MFKVPAFLLTFIIPQAVQSAVVYSGTLNTAIPLNLNGLFLNPLSGVTTTTSPGDWNTAPWINPFFSATGIANDDLLRPVITGTHQVVNIAPVTLIDATSLFAPGESGSSTHIGAAPNQFQLGVPGLIGFAFQPNIGGSTHYGWISATLSNTGPGTLHSYAYVSTPGLGILAGTTTAVPEPSQALLLLGGLMSLSLRHRRHSSPSIPGSSETFPRSSPA